MIALIKGPIVRLIGGVRSGGRYPVDKIDPKLLRLIEAHAAGELPADPENPDFLVPVYVVVEGGNFGGLSSAGYDVALELAHSANITLPIAQIESLANRADVLAIWSPQPGIPHDGPPPAITTEQFVSHLEEAWAEGSQGEGVVVGMVDFGLNILHDAFTHEVDQGGVKSRKTRILRYWVQEGRTTPGTTPTWQRNGKVHSEAEINGFIDDFVRLGRMPPAPLRHNGHGTGTGSVAAGSAWSAGPGNKGFRTGVAPKAKFVVVEAAEDLLGAIQFCFETAKEELGMPCVVNMSLGHLEFPHNNHSFTANRLRDILTQGNPPTFHEGRVFVRSAGNAGVVHNHARLALTQLKLMEIEVKPDQFVCGCFISSTRPGLKVSIAPPARRTRFTSVGPYAGIETVSNHKISISAVPSMPGDTDSHIIVEARRVMGTGTDIDNVVPGTWQLQLDPGPTPHPEVHLWLHESPRSDEQMIVDSIVTFGWAREDDGEGLPEDGPGMPGWKRNKDWIESTLDSESASSESIVVGSSWWNTAKQRLEPFRASSRGPPMDANRLADDNKPDLVAPGFRIATASWQRSGRSLANSSKTELQDGTSFAAPMVAGTVALMLSHDRTLTQAEARSILRSKAGLWSTEVTQELFVDAEINERNIAGMGKLNILAAVKKVKGV